MGRLTLTMPHYTSPKRQRGETHNPRLRVGLVSPGEVYPKHRDNRFVR